MKVAFNKELLIKHRFWLILVLVVPFAAGAIFILSTSVPAATYKTKDELEKKVKAAADAALGLADVKTGKAIEELKKLAAILNSKQNEIHEAAFKAQEQFYTWPVEIEKEFEFTYVPESKTHPEAKGLFAEKIRINKDLAGLPKDELDKNMVHGQIIEVQGTKYIRIEDRSKKKYKFYNTRGIDIVKAGEASKLTFKSLQKSQYVSVFFQKGKYFQDPLTDEELLLYRTSYKEQIFPILALVQPIDARGQGRVRLGTWDFAPRAEPPANVPFFYYQKTEWPQDGTNYSYDVWIAQENLWIQRDIYSLIKDANDSIGKFKVRKEKGPPIRYVCTNPFWEIDIEVKAENTIKATFKNLLPRGQKWDFDLKIYTSNTPGVEPLALKPPKDAAPFNARGYNKKMPGVELDDEQSFTLKTIDDKKALVVDLEKTDILAVEQELTWESAAVRRIDGIYIGPLNPSGNPESHREYPDPLKSYVRDGAPGAAAPAPDAKPVAPPVKGGKPGLRPTAGGGMFGNEQTLTQPGQQVKERYVAAKTNKQLRKLPVAVVLTVEQSHVDRVQAAFNNSRLRFLTTQVLVTHIPGSLRPKVAAVDPKADPLKADPIRPPRPGPGVGQPAPASGGDELEANVEVVIYGTITIYERYPARLLPPADWK